MIRSRLPVKEADEFQMEGQRCFRPLRPIVFAEIDIAATRGRRCRFRFQQICFLRRFTRH